MASSGVVPSINTSLHFEIPEVDWQESIHKKTDSYFFFDPVSRGLTWDRPAKYRKAGPSTNAKLVSQHQRETKLALDAVHESSLHQVCRLGSFDQALKLITESKGNLFALNAKGLTPLEIGAAFFAKPQLIALVAAARTHTPNLFYLAARSSMKEFLQAFSMADCEASGHLAHTNSEGVSLIEMLRHCRKLSPNGIALAKLQHYANQATIVPRLKSREHLRICVVEQSRLPPSTTITISLKLGDRSLGSFYPLHEGGGMTWLESPLPLNRLPTTTRIWFEVHDAGTGQLLGEGWCPMLQEEKKDVTTLRSTRFENLKDIDLTVAKNVTVYRDDVTVDLFSVTGSDFAPSEITISFAYERGTAGAGIEYEETLLQNKTHLRGWVYKKKVGAKTKKKGGGWQKRWCVVDGASLKWYKGQGKRDKEKGNMKLFQHGIEINVERDDASNRERAVHVGNTKKTCVTRCFTVKEHGGKNRRYIYMIDPTHKETRHAMDMRAKWMEALELCCQPDLQYAEDSGIVADNTARIEEHVQTKLSHLSRLSPLEPILTSEKRLLWRYRAHPDLKSEHGMLLKFLLSVDWTKLGNASEANQHMEEWTQSHNALSILPLLHGRYADVSVRDFAVRRIRQAGLSDKQLLLVLPQLVQSLKWDPFMQSSLSTFLFERALNAPRSVGLAFFWFCQVETSYASTETVRFQRYLEQLNLLFEPVVQKDFDAQLDLWGREGEIAKIGHTIRLMSTKKSRHGSVESDDLLNKRMSINFSVDRRASLSLARPHSAASLTGRPKSISRSGLGMGLPKPRRVVSLRRPVGMRERENSTDDRLLDDIPEVTAVNTPKPSTPSPKDNVEKVRVIFKIGDDLRQDCIVLNMLRCMDQLWLHGGLDLLITPYNCASTWETGGLIEVVPDAMTLGQLQGSGVFAKQNYLDAYLSKHNPLPAQKMKALNNFVKSCAGYCVATHIMGIGDRHIDNIMVAKNGRLFHIDFGHVLGNSKTFKRIDRETTTFVFSEAMAKLMKGTDKIRYHIFKDLIGRAYNILRKNSTYLISLFMLMTPAKLPELSCLEDVDVLRQRLRLDLTDEEASASIIKEANKAMADPVRAFDSVCHKIKHKKGVKNKVQGVLKDELSALALVLPDRIQLPYGQTVGRLLVDQCKVLSSATSPLWLVFEKVDDDDQFANESAPAEKDKTRRSSTNLTPQAQALATVAHRPLIRTPRGSIADAQKPDWWQQLNAKRADMAKRYSRVKINMGSPSHRKKTTSMATKWRRGPYVVGDWGLLPDEPDVDPVPTPTPPAAAAAAAGSFPPTPPPASSKPRALPARPTPRTPDRPPTPKRSNKPRSRSKSKPKPPKLKPKPKLKAKRKLNFKTKPKPKPGPKYSAPPDYPAPPPPPSITPPPSPSPSSSDPLSPPYSPAVVVAEVVSSSPRSLEGPDVAPKALSLHEGTEIDRRHAERGAALGHRRRPAFNPRPEEISPEILNSKAHTYSDASRAQPRRNAVARKDSPKWTPNADPNMNRSEAALRAQPRRPNKGMKPMTEDNFQREVMRRIWNAHIKKEGQPSERLCAALQNFGIQINSVSSQKTVKKALELFVGQLMPS